MKTIKGDLLAMYDNKLFDVIVHGCNCQCNMGGGIAALIAKRYPDAQAADNNTVCGLYEKLGTVLPVLQSGWASKWFPRIFKRRYIINAYTQYEPGADANLQAIRLAFRDLAEKASTHGWDYSRIGIPAIGCGIGGLTWEEVGPVIDEEAGHLDITLVEFDG